MKKFVLTLALAITLSACAQQSDKIVYNMSEITETADIQKATVSKVKDGIVNVINQDEFAALIAEWKQQSRWVFKGNRPAIIDFNATWCGPCRKLKPVLEQLVKEYSGKIDFYSIDVDDNRELAMTFRISSIPMLLICPVDSTPQALVGLHPKENIVEAIQIVAKVQ